MKKKLLLLGWDAADWEVINPLMEKGLMPTLKEFLTKASYGNIATLDPPYSPMLWTTVATGKHAFDHGVLGFTEVLPDNSGIRPISTHSRKVKALWNIFNQQGLKSNVVGWWPSNPVENINGVMVSNFYQHATANLEDEWPLPPATISSDKHQKRLAELRLHPQELTASHLLPFIPKLKELDLKEDKVLNGTAKILAHTCSIHNATTYLLEETDWDFMGVYHDGIDHMSHLGMKFRAPQLEGISDEDHENYKEIVDGIYRFHDMMLERILELTDENTYIMILSDHGFRNDHTRMLKLPKGPATPALEHRPYGMLAIKGPGIKKNEKIHGSSLLDIAPTILHIMDQPVGKDMAGNLLTQIFEDTPTPRYIDSWENQPGNTAMISSDSGNDPIAEQEALEQLAELGYIEKSDESTVERIAVTKRETILNLARSYVYAGKREKAIPLFEKVIEENPNRTAHFMLISTYLKTGQLGKAENLIKQCEDFYPDSLNLKFQNGLLAWHRNQFEKATKIFEEVAALNPGSEILIQIGKAYNAQNQYARAQEFLQKGLELKEEIPALHLQLGISHYFQNQYENALDSLLKVVNIFYHYPSAHFYIGRSLFDMGYFIEAANAWEIAAMMKPKDLETRKWLIKVYEKLDRNADANRHRVQIPDKSEVITIVSGLPRSGTSMMMQILEKGGITPLTDNVRESDISNPHGYYEYESVKKLAVDASWMKDAKGKSLKVIAQLLPYLPTKFRYKIILMERDISEVLISQQIMLGRSREEAIKNYPFKMAQVFYDQIEKVHQWVEKQAEVELLIVNYQQIIENTEDEINRIKNFLDLSESVDLMISAIDKKLYRNQTT